MSEDAANLDHHPFGPSSAKRIMSCGYSYKLQNDMQKEGIPLPKDSDVSIKGSYAHDWAADILEGHATIEELEEEEKENNPHLLDSLPKYVNYCEGLKTGSVKWGVETKVNVFDVTFGTCDFFAIHKDIIHIVDYKNGGLQVIAHENSQCLLYGAGIIHDNNKFLEFICGEDKEFPVMLHIVQPNAGKKITTYKTTIARCLQEAASLEHAIKRIKSSQTLHAHPGDWCTFCPGEVFCQSRLHPPRTSGLPTLEHLEKILMAKAHAIAGYNAIERYVYGQALKGKTKHHKIVSARGRRKYLDAAKDILTKLFGNKVFHPRKLIGLGDLEKLAEKEDVALDWDTIVKYGNGGPQLAHIDDKRPLYSDPEHDFEDLDK